EQLDRAHHVRVLHGAHAHLPDVAVHAEQLVLEQDLSATSSAEPTASAPRGERRASYCSRPAGGQPRSRPMRFIIARYGAANAESASRGVSPTNACVLIATRAPAGSWPVASKASRYRSTSGTNRSGWPPMIATVRGRPNPAARMTDCGVPPTATHTGNGSCTGRGHTTASLSAARCLPDQVTEVDSRICSSSSSFSAYSSS